MREGGGYSSGAGRDAGSSSVCVHVVLAGVESEVCVVLEISRRPSRAHRKKDGDDKR